MYGYYLATAENCTITPINPIYLTAMGGELYHGTSNVMINCNCTDANPEDIMWYFANGTKLPLQSTVPKDFPCVVQQNGTLIIPRFNSSYEGKYHCGIENDSLSATYIILRGK